MYPTIGEMSEQPYPDHLVEKMMRDWQGLIIFAGLLGAALLSPAAFGHHSTAGVYDVNEWIELEGVITDLRLANPHSSIALDVVDENGEVTTWSIETGNVAALRRANWTADTLPLGGRVIAGGAPGLRGAPKLLLGQFVLADGSVIRGVGVSAEVPEYATGGNDTLEERPLAASATDEVVEQQTEPFIPHPRQHLLAGFWGGNTPGSARGMGAGAMGAGGNAPGMGSGESPRAAWERAVMESLTDAGRAYVDNYEITDDPSTHCEAPGQMHIWRMFHPVEIIDLDDRIYFFASFMGASWRSFGTEQAPLEFPNRYGLSQFEWEGDTLVITSRQMSEQVIWPPMGLGFSGSPDSWLEERFTLSEDGQQLNYQQTIYDPVFYTEPVVSRGLRRRTDEPLIVDDCVFTQYE